MNAEQFKVAAHAAVEEIIDYNRTLAERPIVPKILPGYLNKLLPNVGPREPQPWTDIQPDIEKLILPGMTHWQHPGFMAYYPADTSYPAMLGELYSAAFNIPGFNWISSPVSTELEVVVMDWIAKMINLPKCFLSDSPGGGMITTTTSEATICAIIASRNRVLSRLCAAEGLDFDSPQWENRAFELQSRLVVLASDQTHSCCQKGAMITGTRFRSIPTSSADGYTLRPQSLRKVIAECEQDGLIPFFLTVSMGTTSTCAIDPVAEIIDSLKDQPDIWVHVDAAYAGAALVCEEYHSLTNAFENVDSFVFNMHKWLAVTFDASCVWFRNRQALTDSLSLARKPPFLEYEVPSLDAANNSPATEYNDWGLVLGRRFRALKVWFVLRSYGTTALQEHVRKGIQQAGLLYNLMTARTDLFDVFSGPNFGLLTFTVKTREGASRHQQQQQQQDGDVDNDKAHDGKLSGGGLTNDASSLSSSEATGQAMHGDRQALANRLTRSALERINAHGKIFLTETTVDGMLLIRVSCGGQNTEELHILSAYRSIVESCEACQCEFAEERSNGVK